MNRTRSTTLAAVAAFALAATLTGCGDGDKDEKDKPLSSAEFKEQANKLCEEASEDTQSYGADITETSSDAEVSDAVQKTVARNKQLVEDIDDLEAPDSIEDDVDSMLDSVEDGLDLMAEVGSVQDLIAFDTTGGPFKDANDKATALGLPKCAE